MGLEKDRGYDKAKSLRGNCCRLRKYQSANYPEVISVVNHLYNEMIDAYGLKLSRESSIKKLKHHIQFFVLNLYKAYCNNPERVIAYSRDHSDYSGKKSRYKNKFGLSFRYSLDSGKDGKPVIRFLEKQGYIVNFPGYYDERNPEKTFSSRMRATGKLIHLIVEMYQISEGMIEHDTSDDELIVVKGIKPKPKWITFEKNGKTIRKKIKGKRKVGKTPDTPAVRGMRKNLEIINAVMEKAEITLDISDAELMQLNVRMLDDPGTYKEAIDFSRKRLHRVFLDRRLDRGGRFYGPWYQNIPKEYRQYIMINGAPTMELDYSSLHPNLLYWYADVDPPESDLYELEGYSKDARKFIKGIFLRMINSSSRLEAKGSIRKAVFYVSKKEKKLKKRMKIPAELGRLQDKYLDPVIDKLLEKHKALQKFIFQGKRLGQYPPVC